MKFYGELKRINSKAELYNRLRERDRLQPGEYDGVGVDFSYLRPRKPTGREFEIVDASANLSRSDFTGALFRNAVLPGTTFAYSDLTGADFTGARLPGSNFTGCDLTDADFSDADLSTANFQGAVLNGTEFSGAELYCTSFYHADLTRAITEDADLSNANLYLAETRKHKRQMKILDFCGKIIERGLPILTWLLIGAAAWRLLI